MVVEVVPERLDVRNHLFAALASEVAGEEDCRSEQSGGGQMMNRWSISNGKRRSIEDAVPKEM